MYRSVSGFDDYVAELEQEEVRRRQAAASHRRQAREAQRRQGASTAQLSDPAPETPPRLRLLEAVRDRENAEIDALLAAGAPVNAGNGMATVYLGEATPREWREQAKKLLFMSERPRFG